MESVAQDDLCAHVFQAARHHAFDGSVCPDGHEDRGFHHAMIEREAAAAGVRVGVGLEQVKFQHGRYCLSYLPNFAQGHESTRNTDALFLFKFQASNRELL